MAKLCVECPEYDMQSEFCRQKEETRYPLQEACPAGYYFIASADLENRCGTDVDKDKPHLRSAYRFGRGDGR